MKLTQRHNSSLHIFEIKDASLNLIEQSLLKRTKKEILFQDILIKDMYELKHHNSYGLGYVSFFICFLVFFIVEMILNPEADRTVLIVVATLTLLSIISYFINTIKIYIPTKGNRIIRLYKNRPNKKRVNEFIYFLEGKVKLAAKKMPEKENLSRFLKD